MSAGRLEEVEAALERIEPAIGGAVAEAKAAAVLARRAAGDAMGMRPEIESGKDGRSGERARGRQGVNFGSDVIRLQGQSRYKGGAMAESRAGGGDRGRSMGRAATKGGRSGDDKLVHENVSRGYDTLSSVDELGIQDPGSRGVRGVEGDD